MTRKLRQRAGGSIHPTALYFRVGALLPMRYGLEAVAPLGAPLLGQPTQAHRCLKRQCAKCSPEFPSQQPSLA